MWWFAMSIYINIHDTHTRTPTVCKYSFSTHNRTLFVERPLYTPSITCWFFGVGFFSIVNLSSVVGRATVRRFITYIFSLLCIFYVYKILCVCSCVSSTEFTVNLFDKQQSHFYKYSSSWLTTEINENWKKKKIASSKKIIAKMYVNVWYSNGKSIIIWKCFSIICSLFQWMFWVLFGLFCRSFAIANTNFWPNAIRETRGGGVFVKWSALEQTDIERKQ